MNKKLLGLLVASVGSVAAVCTSLALYISAPKDASFEVGISTDTDVTYKITETNTESNVKTINPEKGLSVEYSLGATPGNNYTQPYVTGKLTVTVTGDQTLLSYLEGGMKLTYEQSEEDANASNYFFNNDERFNKLNLALVEEEGSQTLTGSLNATVDITNGTKSLLTLGLNEAGVTNFLSVAESELNVNITFTEVDSDYAHAYVVGDITGWTKSDEYMMVPNIYATDGYQWMYIPSETQVAALTGTQFKCLKGDSWSGGSSNHVGENDLLGIYWIEGNELTVDRESFHQGQ